MNEKLSEIEMTTKYDIHCSVKNFDLEFLVKYIFFFFFVFA